MIKSLQKIGRRERIYLMEFYNKPIEAKIDTGAFRTAIHCESCEEIEVDGKKLLEAKFCFDGKKTKSVRFSDYRLRTIRNSFGQTEERYCVRTVIRLGGRNIRSDVSLTNRSDMKYHVLIGRKTIGRKFLVDVSKTFLDKTKKRNS